MCSLSGAASTSVSTRGLADPRHRAGRGVDERELARRVVLEQLLVVLVRQRVARLVRAALAALAVGLLDARAVGGDRGLGRRAGMLGDDLHEQRLLIRHPLHGAAEHRIEARVAEAMDVTARCRRATARPHPSTCCGTRTACRRRPTRTRRRSRRAAARSRSRACSPRRRSRASARTARRRSRPACRACAACGARRVHRRASRTARRPARSAGT